MCNYIQLWGLGVSYRTSDVAPVVASIVFVLVLVLVAAAIVVLVFIAALLLAALVLRFIAVTATAAAAVAASALVTAAASTDKTVGTVADLTRWVKQMFADEKAEKLRTPSEPPVPNAATAPQNSRKADDLGELLAREAPGKCGGDAGGGCLAASREGGCG